MDELQFYKQPFYQAKYGDWVYDVADNFVFQFFSDYDEAGNYADGCKELQASIIKSLNIAKLEPVDSLQLSVSNTDGGCILNHSKPLILIRGWGNLTGIGAHNLPAKEAAQIQDNFRDWLISKLSVK